MTAAFMKERKNIPFLMVSIAKNGGIIAPVGKLDLHLSDAEMPAIIPKFARRDRFIICRDANMEACVKKARAVMKRYGGIFPEILEGENSGITFQDFDDFDTRERHMMVLDQKYGKQWAWVVGSPCILMDGKPERIRL